MKEENITTLTFDELEEEDDQSAWEQFDAMTDEEVEADAMADPDNPPLTEEELNQFRRAIYRKGELVWEDDKTIGELFQEISDFAMIPVERDIAAWFKAQGQNYQAIINAVLKDYVSAHQNVA